MIRAVVIWRSGRKLLFPALLAATTAATPTMAEQASCPPVVRAKGEYFRKLEWALTRAPDRIRFLETVVAAQKQTCSEEAGLNLAIYQMVAEQEINAQMRSRDRQDRETGEWHPLRTPAER